MPAPFELTYEWVTASATEAGEASAAGAAPVRLDGVLIRPKGVASETLFVFLHPPSALQLAPIETETARLGGHILCAGSRYVRNEPAALLEKVMLDLGAYVRAAREDWGYRRVVLLGWSAVGSLGLFYQSQAERPSLETTADGQSIDLTGLPGFDAVVFQAAQVSRARMLAEMIDPSVIDEADPDRRDPELDLYGPLAPQAPFAADFLDRYRAAQLLRIRRITARVKAELSAVGGSGDRTFVTHRTLADPYFLDPAIAPNARRPNSCWMGDPRTVNSGAAGLARVATLRSWLSQWSPDDTKADSVAAARVATAPLLVIENGADEGVPRTHLQEVFQASASPDKRYETIPGATHAYADKPELLRDSLRLVRGWLIERELLEAADGEKL